MLEYLSPITTFQSQSHALDSKPQLHIWDNQTICYLGINVQLKAACNNVLISKVSLIDAKPAGLQASYITL